MEPALARMIQDTQERLIFCAQTHIRDEIEGFSPSAADLDYPQKLIDFNKAALASAASASESKQAATYPDGTPMLTDDDSGAGGSGGDMCV